MRWQDPAFLQSIWPQVRFLIEHRRLTGPVDFRGIVIGSEGGAPDLIAENLFNVEVEGADLSFCRIEGSMSEARFEAVSFAGGELAHVLARKSEFHNCSFEDARLQASVDDARFVQCGMARAMFTGGKALHEWGGRRARFERCDLAGASFNRVEFRATAFENCSFASATFSHCDLRGAKFVGDVPSFEDCLQ